MNMEKEFYQVILTFDNTELQNIFKSEILESEDDDLFIDNAVDEALSEDPLTLILLVGILTKEAVKSVTSESVKWIFEKLKDIFLKKTAPSKIKDSIPVEIRIDNKIFLFTYEVATKKYSVKELK